MTRQQRRVLRRRERGFLAYFLGSSLRLELEEEAEAWARDTGLYDVKRHIIAPMVRLTCFWRKADGLLEQANIRAGEWTCVALSRGQIAQVVEALSPGKSEEVERLTAERDAALQREAELRAAMIHARELSVKEMLSGEPDCGGMCPCSFCLVNECQQLDNIHYQNTTTPQFEFASEEARAEWEANTKACDMGHPRYARTITFAAGWARRMEEALARGESIADCQDRCYSEEVSVCGISGHMWMSAALILKRVWLHGPALFAVIGSRWPFAPAGGKGDELHG